MFSTLLLCLTLNVYHESRGVSIEAQEAVAAITMNRTKDKDYPSNVCKVVYAPKAFSWTQQHHRVTDKEAFAKAKAIALQYLQGKKNSTIGNRLYFNERRLGKRYNTPYKPIVLGGLMMY